MEKEQLLSALKAKLGTTCLSERTLSEYVVNILPTITSEEQVNDTFYASHVGILKSMDGQLNKDVADRVKAARGEWEKQHPTPQNPNPSPTEPKNESNKEFEEMKAMLVAMQQKLDAQDKANLENNLRDSVKSAMKAKGATDEAVMMYTFKGENIDTSKSVEELTESYLKNYDANYRILRGDGALPRNGEGERKAAEDKFMDEYFAKKVVEGRFPDSK